MKSCLILLILLITTTTGFSQEKLEREYRIKQCKVPLKALEFMRESFGSIGMKWYGEENLNGKNIEAKIKHNGMLFSVKFDTSGILQDVEMVVNYNTLPETTRATIEKQLVLLFSKYRIQKTQIQWLGNPKVLSSLIKRVNIQERHVVNYEITLEGRKESRTEYFEFLFNESGEVIRQSKIIQRNNHNLIY